MYTPLTLLLLVACPSLQDTLDGDRDGWSPEEGDCDDGDPTIYPGAFERPNADDDDCDDIVDEQTSNQDLDLDHYSDADYGGPDCDDGDPEVNPEATEQCSDGIDNNCDQSADPCVFAGDSPLTMADTWWGGESGDSLGSALSGVGDLTGDGRPDLGVGAPGAQAVQILSLPAATSDGLASEPQLYTLSADVVGMGFALAGTQDVDGDGYADVAAASAGPAAELGAVVLWFGPVTDEGAADELWLVTDAAGRLGQALAGGADLDDDGSADLVVGQPLVGDGSAEGGQVYLWSGGDAALGEPSEDTPIVLYQGFAYDQAGTAFATDDWNGDGIADLAIGSPSASDEPASPSAQSTGAVAILVGGTELGEGGAEPDASLPGTSSQDRAGHAVVAPGDRDGDGYADLVVGAPYADPYGSADAGLAYELQGPLDGLLPLEAACATWQGGETGERAGAALAAAGDLDGGGHADLAIGAPRATAYDGAEAGRVYLVPGPTDPGAHHLSAASATWGGPDRGAASGGALAGAGDLDQDGYDDLAVGAPEWILGADVAPSGAAFLLLGLGI